MGMVIPVMEEAKQEQEMAMEEGDEHLTDEMRDLKALKGRPGILLVGPPGVGKRSLINRLVARAFPHATLESGATCQGWTIDTKYYTANVCMWVAQLDNAVLEDTDTIQSEFGFCEALVMVFDLSNSNSFRQLREWVTGVELGNFEILLCVGNKADCVPEHFGHAKYRRKLQKKGESSSDPHPEFWNFGIDRAEGSSLLVQEVESVEDRRQSCIEWCSHRGIEYIEACAINETFDECMSVDGDLQGVARILGALSAHMWPGLVMKDQSASLEAVASQHEQEEMTSEDDSDYYIEYELLSNGSAEPWEAYGWEEQWSFSSHLEEPSLQATASVPYSTDEVQPNIELDNQQVDNAATAPVSEASEKSALDETEAPTLDTSPAITSDENGRGEYHGAVQIGHRNAGQPYRQKTEELDDVEKLMSEITSMRLNMRSMPDHQRRETAAHLAMRMASMFNVDEDRESDID